VVRKFGSEKVILKTKPSYKPAFALFGASIPFFVLSVYLYFRTMVPYVYPFLSFFIGFIIFYKGISLFLINRRTTYYVTDKRIIRDYQFIKFKRVEIPIKQIRGIEEGISILGKPFKLGDVRMVSGKGSSMEIVFRFVNDSTEIADKIRRLITV
jgi:uncharacterized membrane protein YdbT with pleckstrin-like domain